MELEQLIYKELMGASNARALSPTRMPSEPAPLPAKGKELAAVTWKEIGCSYKPLRRGLVVRTENGEVKTASGLLWLPPTQADVFHGMGHLKQVVATVLSSGKLAKVEPGERVIFNRSHFKWYHKLPDGTQVGYIDENEVHGYVED